MTHNRNNWKQVALIGTVAGVFVTAQLVHAQSQTAPAARPVATSTTTAQTAQTRPVATRPGAVLMRRALQARRPDSLALRLPKAQLDQVRLPVVLPRAGVIDTAKAKLLNFGDAYALNLPQPQGKQLTMYGNRTFVQADRGAISSRPTVKLAGVPEDIRISQMEDGWTATFTRYGVVYSIDLSCDDNASPDCTSDAYLRKAIAEFTDVSVGAQAQTEAKAPKTEASTNWLNQVAKVFSPKTGG
ncbi:MAG: hypothetical protein JF615_00495 [Asticcacaulis sp.]|nr:hypothetical protein [Asticcacaulis sp.]